MRDIIQSLALGALIAVFCALTSPFGAVTYLPFAIRLIYWFGLIMIVIGVDLAVRIVRRRLNRPGSFQWRLVEVTALSAPLVWGTILLVQNWIGYPVSHLFYAQVFLCVCVINAAIVGLMHLTHAYPKLAQGEVENAEKSEIPNAGFRRLLPFEYRQQDILAVSAEDHYIRVHTPNGTPLLHMRLSDAIELLAETEGARAHRSWYVLRSGVKTIRRKGGKTVIHLHSDAEVPVSRSGIEKLKELEWL